MLKKQNRLRKTNEFKRAFRSGKGYEAKGILVKTRISGETNARVGVIVSKKVAKEAVRRNRIRRMVSEAVQEMLPELKNDRDVVVVTLPTFMAKKTHETASIIKEVFRKASLFK